MICQESAIGKGLAGFGNELASSWQIKQRKLPGTQRSTVPIAHAARLAGR
jgi:hypothetical protein